MTTAAGAIGRDGRILGLIGTGHFMSHFYMLCLPPLFPLLKVEFGVSYAALGLIMTVIHIASGSAQIPVGFIVDRHGPFGVLAGGLAVLAAATALIAVAPGYWTLVGLAVLAGIGHSVFHPADYAILSSVIGSARMGRAFSIHTFSGHLGSATAPATVIFLAAVLGWRQALIATGVFGFLVLFAMLSQRRVLAIDVALRPAAPDGGGGDGGPGGGPGGGTAPEDGWRLLLSPPIMLFFLFFVVTSMTSSGVQAFAVAAMVALHGTPLTAASTALTGFLFASALGVLIGGHVADRTRHHDIIAATVFFGTAVVMVAIGAVALPAAALIALFTVTGLAQGMVRPARDMLVRAVTPKAASGKVFGFVSTGISVGGAVSPVLFGWIVDRGAPEWVFYMIAVFMLAGVATVLAARRQRAAIESA